MSRSLSELAHAAEQRARAFRLVLCHHPDATPEVLWDDGPEVPCVCGTVALALATGLDVRTCKGLHVFLPFFTLTDGREDPEDEESRPFEVRVYTVRNVWAVAYVGSVLERVSPEMMGALLDAVRKA